MSQIKTVTTVSGENEVVFDAFYAFIWFKNTGEGDVYVAPYSGFSAGDVDVSACPAGQMVRITAHKEKVYILGASTLEIHAQNFSDCPFKVRAKGGGGDFTPEQMAVINSHTVALSYPNLVDKNAEGATKDGYYDYEGGWHSAAGFYQSDYIPVEDGKVYTSMPHNVFILWYDADKKYLGQTSSTTFNNNGYGTALARAKYAKFLTTSEYYDTWQVEQSMFNTTYVPYGTARQYTNTDYSEMQGVAFGTSLTYRAQTTGGYLASLQEISGVIWDNYGVGSGQIYTDNASLSILAKIKSYSASYYQSKDVCLIEGFVNDWYQNNTLGDYDDATETSVCGCLRSAINYILTANPLITLFVVLDHCGKGITAETEVNTSGLTQYEYYEVIAKVADSMSVPVIKLYKDSGINHYTANNYLIDNIHPNALGAKQTAYTIWDKMKTYHAKFSE